MAAYLVAQLVIHDRDAFSQYEAGFMDVFSQYGGKILAVDEAPEKLEGDWPFTRTVLLEFPSKDVASEWYHSEGYQKISAHRRNGSNGNLVIINGLPV